MRAVVFEKSNSPEVLVYREVEKPVPNIAEVLIKVHAVSINAADYRSMRLGIVPKRKIYGADIAGTVEAAGTSCQKFKAGDEVFGDLSGCGFGGFAEYVTAPESALAFKPASVSFEDAAAVPMAAITALQGLRDQGQIQPGQKVLIYGAGGGVGTFAVQFARHFGTDVTAVCSAKNVDLIRSLGADHVIDYAEQDVFRKGENFDLILAVNGNHPLSVYKRALTPRGIFVLVGGALSQVIPSLLFGAILSIGSKKMRFLAAKPNPADLAFIIQLVEEGKVKPVIDRCYPLQETAEAMRYLMKEHARGKIVIQLLAE